MAGTESFAGAGNAFGVAPRVDVGNTHDEMAFVFGGTIRDAAGSLDDFVNRISRTVSHEMGHTFGLAHLTTATGTDAQTHHLMEVNNRDFTRDMGFQDIAYNTESGRRTPTRSCPRRTSSGRPATRGSPS